MADKYTRVEPKIPLITIISIVAFFVVAISIIFIFQPKNQTIIYSSYEKTATSFFTEDHPFYEVTYAGSLFHKGLETIIEKDEVVALYIGSPECPSCQKHIGAFQKYFEDLNFGDYVPYIYYINTNNDASGMTKLVELYDQVLTTTPQFIIFKNGEIVATFEPGSSDVASDINRSVTDFFEDEAIPAVNAN